jgi:putative ABC transport system permease protein
MIPLTYNVRSLLVRKPTTIATAAGIALVVFVIAGSSMLSGGIHKTMATSGKPGNAVVLRAGSDAELSSSIETPSVGLIMAAPGVAKDANGAPIGVGEQVVVITQEKVGATEGEISNVQVRGVPPEVLALRPEVRVVTGRPPQPGTDEVMVGQRIAGRFKGVQLGQSFELKKNRPVQVVGVFEAGGAHYESEVWADIDTVRTSYGREGLVSSVTVKLESPSQFDAFAATLEGDKALQLDAWREDEFYEKQSENTAQFMMGMGITIAVFFSIGAMIGATITMYAAVAQRQREIGTLRALGFSRGAVLVSFMVEAFILALAGGLIGVIAALALGTVSFPMMNFATWSEIVFKFDATPGILLVSLALGGVMGLLGGLFPAIRAARTSPIAAMRA